MSLPRVSIITPTYNRPYFLRQLMSCFLDQTYQPIEWLIFDDSPVKDSFFSSLKDTSIRYFWTDERITVGEKRNHLIERSEGEIIVHFDDDDYYAPSYVSERIAKMKAVGADASLLNGFFVCQLKQGQYGFYLTDIKQGPAYRFSKQGISAVSLEEQNMPLIHLCYGFAYVYKRTVGIKIRFPDSNIFEDRAFLLQAIEQFKVFAHSDEAIITIHSTHHHSSSGCFPQFLIPQFMINQLAPEAAFYMQTLARFL
jgi:glycosyltransferase involved in cell wall biosynthesis